MEADVAATVNRLTVEKTLTVREFLEGLRPRLLSESPDDRESALSEVVAVLTRLPRDYLTGEQVGLLLDFLLGRLESSALAGGDVLEGIRHLVLFSDNLPAEFEVPLFQALFRDGNVQSWPQKDRMKQYDVLQYLLNNRKTQLLPLGSDLVMSFIRAIEGERDPRCLLVVFRMFVTVASSFSLSPFSEDMFEVVACYYPVEFKPLPGDSSITCDQLAAACRSTLTAHATFAPFCYMLIEEKFEDDETTHEQKVELCRLITAAASKFPPGSLLPHLGPILGGIRSIAVDPKQKGPLSPEVAPALCAMTKAVEKCGKDKLEAMNKAMLENMEPFVLQAEMGLSERALSLLKCLIEGTDTVATNVIDKSISWIISLIQGKTVNTAANRSDICKEGLQFIVEWIQIARKKGQVALFDQYESTLFASLDIARESVPSEAKIAMYRCMQEYLSCPTLSDDVISRCDQLISAGLESVENEGERDCYLGFLSTNAAARWQEHNAILMRNKTSDSDKYFAVLCASVVHEESWQALSTHILEILSKEATESRLNSLISMSERLKTNTSLIDLMVPSLVDCVYKKAANESDPNYVISVSLQSLSLLLSPAVHSQLCHQLMTVDSLLSRMVLAQSEDTSLILSALQSTKLVESRLLLTFSFMNKTGLVDQIPEEIRNEGWFLEVSAKALLLCGKLDGVKRTQEFFSVLSKGATPCELCCLYDFSTPQFDPTRGNYHTTALWRQRIFCQTVPSYIKAVVDAEDKSSLLLLLPSILLFAKETGPAVESQLCQFLPVFVAALSVPFSSVSPSVFSALPAFISAVPTEELDQLSVAVIGKRLADTVRQEKMNLPTLLTSLEALDLLAKRAKLTATQPLIGCVVGAATHCLAHKKRIIRQKAAAVKNTWDVLALK